MDFNVENVTNEIIDFIRDYYSKNNLKGAVIGISGGKDSAVVAALFVRALGSENVKGLWMPCHSKESDYNDAKELANHFGFELLSFELTYMYDNYLEDILGDYLIEDEDLIDANINIKPRLRMLTLYYFAAMLSKMHHGTYIVPGTSNKCELYTGYFTKGGDSVSDIRVLADLTVDEVIQVGDYLGVPYHICHKTPDDGLSGKTDEDKLGVKYNEITEVIKEEESDYHSEIINDETRAKVLKLHQANLHKFNTPTYRKGK